MTYDDNLTSHADCKDLWQQVLTQAVEDAIQGVKIAGKSASVRADYVRKTRDYLTVPNKDFNEVCHLAGMDPQAFRERVARMIAAAPSPEELADAEVQSSRMITFNGRTLSLQAWSRELGITYQTLQNRLNKGWSIERALTEPVIDNRARTRRLQNAAIIRRIADAFRLTLEARPC